MQPKLPEDFCIRLFDYMKDTVDEGGTVRNKKSPQRDENVTRMLFEVSVAHIVKGSSEEKAKLLLKLVKDPKIQALKPVGSIKAKSNSWNALSMTRNEARLSEGWDDENELVVMIVTPFMALILYTRLTYNV